MMPPFPSVRRAAAVLAILLSLAACTTQVGIVPVDTQIGYKIHSQNVLSDGRLSDSSQTVLRRLNLLDAFEADPAGVLSKLHGDVGTRLDDDRLFALAELSLLHGMKTRDPARLLAFSRLRYVRTRCCFQATAPPAAFTLPIRDCVSRTRSTVRHWRMA